MNSSPMSEQIAVLKTALDFYTYDRERKAQVGETVTTDTITPVLQRGIGDLDFDPKAFLLYGMEEPEGWAVKK